jgi:PKD repeat protein
MKLFVITSILYLNFTAAVFSQNWVTTGGNNQRNGISRITGPNSVSSAYWSVNSSNSTIWGNSVYTYNDKFVTARVTFSPFYKAKIELRNINTGAFIWEKQINDSSIMYAVGFNEDAVYAHDYKTGILYALNIADGSVKWSIPSFMFPGNTGLLFACEGDPVDMGRRINKTTGIAKWVNNYVIPVGPDGGYALYGNTYYHWTGTITTPKRLIAINLDNGQTRYTSDPLPGDGDQENDLCIGPDGTIYICRDGGALFAFQDNGSAFVQLWSRTPGVIVKGVGKDGTLYASSIGSNNVIRLNPSNGNLMDSAQTLTPLGYFAAGADSTIYISTGETGNGRYIAFTPDLQTVKWQLSVPYNYYSGPSLSREGIFITVGAGTEIKAFRTNISRKPAADFRAGTTIVPATLSTDFFDLSSYAAASWNWSFPGSNTPTSTQQNPANIVYNTVGLYPVTLVASNSNGTDTLVKNCYISVVPWFGIHQISSEIPSEFSLSQNYPNPFNPSTLIRFALPVGSTRRVALTVFDAIGREIAILVDEELKPGIYEVSWDGTNYPSGVFFYQFTLSSEQSAKLYSETKKMVLVK